MKYKVSVNNQSTILKLNIGAFIKKEEKELQKDFMDYLNAKEEGEPFFTVLQQNGSNMTALDPYVKEMDRKEFSKKLQLFCRYNKNDHMMYQALENISTKVTDFDQCFKVINRIYRESEARGVIDLLSSCNVMEYLQVKAIINYLTNDKLTNILRYTEAYLNRELGTSKIRDKVEEVKPVDHNEMENFLYQNRDTYYDESPIKALEQYLNLPVASTIYLYDVEDYGIFIERAKKLNLQVSVPNKTARRG